MFVRSVVGVLVLGIAFMFSALPSAAARAAPANDAPVVVAEDKTVEADCQFRINTADTARPCDPGTVIFARKTTYGEVKQAGMTEYALLSNDPAQDQAVQDALVGKVRHRIKPKHMRPFGCAYGWKEQRGSYLSIPGNAASARISYSFQYTVYADCSVVGVSDAAQISVGQLQWLQSCSRGTAQCARRGINMTVNWSAYQPLLDTTVGAEYRHLSAAPCWNCGMPYGIHNFW